ncbi:MAG: sulfotransferase, partial [Gammaproteobacteria bacterium]|nr:sulfotransferase [Gammaproteobacteria bacterium]
MYPTFLGIGTTKAGTTWLYANLREHPQIWLPPIKEIHYFDSKEKEFSEKDHNRFEFKRRGFQYWRYRIRKRLDEGHLSLSWRHIIWYCRYFSGKRDDNWYSSLFPYRGYQVIGDISPGYDNVSSATIARIHELMPRAKIILMLRNPIYRTWSSLRMEAAIFGNPNLDNELEVIEFIASRVASENYLQTIEKWNGYFPAEQM